jgi:gas vesicle protein
MLVEYFKKDMNNSLKEIQENTAKQVEAIKKEAQKSLKELQENTANQVEDLKEETQKNPERVPGKKKKKQPNRC